jgi:hypothetical protein
MIFKEDYAKEYAQHLGICPYENWKLREMQQIINSVNGYENVNIVFEFFENAYEYKNRSYVCRIKLIDFENVLLKYEWVIQDNDRENASVIAWNDATKILLRDIWITAIKSFKQQDK